jgi:hypothetical protein
VDDAETTRALRRQNEAAVVLALAGYDVEQHPVVPGGKRPDYRIEGRTFDCYAPSSGRARNIATNVAEEKVWAGQADGIVLVLDDSSVSLEALRTQLSHFPIAGLREIIVVWGNRVVPFFPFDS